MFNIRQSTFRKVIGEEFVLLPLISKVLPIFLIFLVLASYFELVPRLFGKMGAKSFQLSEEPTIEDLEKGKEMLRKSKKHRS